MIATVSGITVMGTPEEIQRFRELNMSTSTTTNINVQVNKSAPEIADQIFKQLQFKSAGVKLMP